MSWTPPQLVPRSAPVILLILALAAAVAFAAVGHLVTRFTAHRQARSGKLYVYGLASPPLSNGDSDEICSCEDFPER